MPPEAVPQGAAAPHHALEPLYRAARINRRFPSTLQITREGEARIQLEAGERHFNAAGAVHGTACFKILDDAAFYAANGLVTDRFLLTAALNLWLMRPLNEGGVVVEGRWISGRRRAFVAEPRPADAQGEEVTRGLGTIMRLQNSLFTLPRYAR
jgi:acyl-coenzyme A thioesterase PaaI-like protein